MKIISFRFRVDNRIFRRPNNRSIAVQTDSIGVTLPQCNFNSFSNEVHRQTTCSAVIPNSFVKNESASECVVSETMARYQMQQQPAECVDKKSESKTGESNSGSDLKKFRIPKKNPFATNPNNDESRGEAIAHNGKMMENSLAQPRHHLPKKNPKARRFDGDENLSNGTHYVSRSERQDVEGEKSKPKDRKDDDHRRRSPVERTSGRSRLDYNRKTSSNSDEQRDSRRNNGKHSRDRDSSDEMERFANIHTLCLAKKKQFFAGTLNAIVPIHRPIITGHDLRARQRNY